MKKIIVHFGMHKTGSSSIQRSLHKNLSDSNFHYISLVGQENQGGPLMNAFSPDIRKTPNFTVLGMSEEQAVRRRRKILSDFDEQLQSSEGRIPILSAEVISSMPKITLLNLKDFLQFRGYKASLCGYIRSPAGYVSSSFQEKLKRGGKKNFSPENNFPDYKKMSIRLGEVFGKENVEYWRFDRNSLKERDVVIDFCNALGLGFERDKIIHVNEGLSLPAIRLLYSYRKFYPVREKGRLSIRADKELVEKMYTLKGGKFNFHSSLIEPILYERRADVEWLKRRVNIDAFAELTENDSNAIKNEDELLDFDGAEVQWLKSQLGMESDTQLEAREVANCMHKLRQMLLGGIKKASTVLEM